MKIFYSHLYLETGDTIHPSRLPVGGIREDDKRVYFFSKDFLGSPKDEELLLYDFNMHIDDTVYHSNDGFWKSIVLDIDSVQIGDKYRMRYLVDNGWFYHNQDYIIEGIGSVINGLLGHITDIPTCGTHYWEHVCFFFGNQMIYKNPSFSDCSAGVDLSTVNNRVTSTTSIYPNPFKRSVVLVSSLPGKSMSIQVFNAAGQIVLEKYKVESIGQIEIPGPAGIYFAIIKE